MRSPRWLRRLGSSLLIGGQAVAATARGRINTIDLFDQLLEAGPGSFLIVIITGIAAGSVFNIQVAAELSRQGAGSTVGGILALGLAREIAPLLTATLLTGKVATAYAAQLGTMKVTEQIDAITMLRTDPVEYLVVPRLIAMVVMAPVQCLLFFGVAIWSGQIRYVGIGAMLTGGLWTLTRLRVFNGRASRALDRVAAPAPAVEPAVDAGAKEDANEEPASPTGGVSSARIPK